MFILPERTDTEAKLGCGSGGRQLTNYLSNSPQRHEKTRHATYPAESVAIYYYFQIVTRLEYNVPFETRW